MNESHESESAQPGEAGRAAPTTDANGEAKPEAHGGQAGKAARGAGADGRREEAEAPGPDVDGGNPQPGLTDEDEETDAEEHQEGEALLPEGNPFRVSRGLLITLLGALGALIVMAS